MTIQIPLSQSGDPVAFAAALEAHRADLAAHRIGPANVPVPTDPYWIFDSLIQRVPAAGPVATRGPDTFQVRAHEIVDDTPKPPPPPPLPTLEQKKQALLNALYTAASTIQSAILSPARAQLLALDSTEAQTVWQARRTPGQVAVIAAHTAFQSRRTEIQKNATVAAVEIEDLTADNVDTWKVPIL